jgi:hypothetical protein
MIHPSGPSRRRLAPPTTTPSPPPLRWPACAGFPPLWKISNALPDCLKRLFGSLYELCRLSQRSYFRNCNCYPFVGTARISPLRLAANPHSLAFPPPPCRSCLRWTRSDSADVCSTIKFAIFHNLPIMKNLSVALLHFHTLFSFQGADAPASLEARLKHSIP